MSQPRRTVSLKEVLGLNIRVHRAAQGLSQEALAERSGIKRTYIGALERGEIDPRLGTVTKIAAGLGIDAFRLLVPAQQQLAAGITAIAEKRGH